MNSGAPTRKIRHPLNVGPLSVQPFYSSSDSSCSCMGRLWVVFALLALAHVSCAARAAHDHARVTADSPAADSDLPLEENEAAAMAVGHGEGGHQDTDEDPDVESALREADCAEADAMQSQHSPCRHSPCNSRDRPCPWRIQYSSNRSSTCGNRRTNRRRRSSRARPSTARQPLYAVLLMIAHLVCDSCAWTHVFILCLCAAIASRLPLHSPPRSRSRGGTSRSRRTAPQLKS